ncbi:MAG: undecaprenyl-phosphate glucose phosphotransferase [Deltaproteobacteria bacterium]|nr:undecaprenyl-phosphate glucose phosphotransferase [Deltaproteobacteria bacterium]
MTRSSTQGGLLRNHESAISALQRLVDSGLIVGALYSVCSFVGQPWHAVTTTAAVLAVLFFRITGESQGLYRGYRTEGAVRELQAVATAWLFVPPALLLIGFITKVWSEFPRSVIVGWLFLAPVLLGGWRVGMRLILNRVRAAGMNTRRVAILGATDIADKLVSQISEMPWLGMNLSGVYDDRAPDRRHPLKSIPSVGAVSELVEDARDGKIDIVFIALPLRAETRIAESLRSLADTTATVYMVADFFTFDLLHARWTQIGNVPVVSIYDSPFRGVGGWLKRIEDVVVGSFIVALIAIPMMAIAIAVKLNSSGPVFFRQRRYGLNGKEIRILKFRTMRVLEDGPVIKQATKDDPRITPIGAFLRRTSLDELPQFLQVITGEMSIVGPRPHAVAHNEEYRSLIHGYMLRHKVKPGITGWAQVNGWRGETDELAKMEKRVEHDLAYIHDWNLFWDLKIILLTIVGNKKKRNAY